MKTVELIEKRVKVDNSDNAERGYTVSATVTVSRGSITNMQDGEVRNAEGSLILATFNGYGQWLNTSFSVSENRGEILAAIEEFNAALNASEITE